MPGQNLGRIPLSPHQGQEDVLQAHIGILHLGRLLLGRIQKALALPGKVEIGISGQLGLGLEAAVHIADQGRGIHTDFIHNGGPNALGVRHQCL